MKNKVILFCLLINLQPVFSQSSNADSVKAGLVNYKNPVERFTATIKYLEATDTYQGNTIDSATCIDLLQIAQQLKNDSLLAISYNWIGYFFTQSKGDNTTALEYFFKALPLAEKFNDKRRISSIYFDIASVYFYLKNIEEVFNFTKKGGETLPDKTSPKYDYMLVQYQRNMGLVYLENNQLDSALYYIQAAEQTNDRLKLRSYKAQTLTLLATIYARMNENVLADVYFNKAKNIIDSLNVRKELFYRRYIPFLVERNRIDEAKLQTERFWHIASESQNPNVKLLAAGFKRNMFDRLNKTDSAYYYAKVESEIKDSVFNQDNQNAISALAFKEQLRTIEDAARKAEEESQRKQNIQFALIAVGIVSFIILFLLLSRTIIVSEKWISFFGILGLLIVFEFINLLMHPFLERVTHHSPFLMLLALVCIAALLVPMHHKVEKWATTKLVEKNKQIRLAAAKKTIQQLDKQVDK